VDRTYTQEQLAEHLQLPVDTIRYWRTCGKGPKWFPAGKHVRYREADVIRWEEEQVKLAQAG
jgi:DNA-binding transcriptional MerR regulator